MRQVENRTTLERPSLPDRENEPADSQKRQQILEGARAVFLANGFDGASMNEIARVAGVSKGTLYVYFQSKEALFEVLIRLDRSRQAERLFDFDEHDADVRAVLRSFGLRLAGLLTRPESIAQIRTVIGIAARLPEIGQAFFEAGPRHGTGRLAAYLDRQVAYGRLSIRDTRRAATQFGELSQGWLVKRLLFRESDTISDAEIVESVERACDMFLAAYSAPADERARSA